MKESERNFAKSILNRLPVDACHALYKLSIGKEMSEDETKQIKLLQELKLISQENELTESGKLVILKLTMQELIDENGDKVVVGDNVRFNDKVYMIVDILDMENYKIRIERNQWIIDCYSWEVELVKRTINHE